MNVKTLIFSVLLGFCITLSAQKDDDDKKGKLGILAGWNNASTSADEFDTKSVSGFYAGAVWEHKFVPSVRFHSGLVYNQNGYRLKDKNTNLENVKYSYLNVPMIGKFQVANFYALLGPQIGVRLGGKYTFDDGTPDQKIKGDFKSYDVAAQLGLGFNVAIIGIEGRYNWGLTDLNKTDGGAAVYNRYFELGLHVKLW